LELPIAQTPLPERCRAALFCSLFVSWSLRSLIRVGSAAMIAKRIVELISPSLLFGIGCFLLFVGGVMLWWIEEDFESTVQRTLWRPYPACRIVGWSFVTFFILFALFGLTYAPPPPLRSVASPPARTIWKPLMLIHAKRSWPRRKRLLQFRFGRFIGRPSR